MSQKLQKTPSQRWWWELHSAKHCGSQYRPRTAGSNTSLSSYWSTLRAGDAAGRAATCWATPGWHLGLSAPSSKPGHHTTSKTGQGHPSRSQSSPLPSAGGTSVAIMLSSLADVHLATHLPHCVVFCPSLSSSIWTTQLWITFSSSYVLVHEVKKYLVRLQRLWVQPIKALFYCGQDPSVSPFSYLMLDAAPAWQNLCQLNVDLPESFLKSTEKTHRSDIDQHAPEAQKSPVLHCKQQQIVTCAPFK